MSERKVLNKYYPPDFDPSKIPRMKLPKNRQYTVRLMAPFNMRCKTCGEYIYKGKKFNARKEDVENDDYLGIRIYRFYIKCTRCLQEISFKTDPKNTDYEIEAGATRNFMALKLAEEQAVREEEEAKEEEASNPMKLLENRTKQSKNEIELLESLEELKDLNKRQEVVDYDTMLMTYDTSLSKREREERMQQLDEEYIKTIKFQNSGKRKLVVEEEIVEEITTEPSSKSLRPDEEQPSSSISKEGINSRSSSNQPNQDPLTSNNLVNNWAKSESKIANSIKKKSLLGIVKKKSETKETLVETNTAAKQTNNEAQKQSIEDEKKPAPTGLSLLGSYSDSDSGHSD